MLVSTHSQLFPHSPPTAASYAVCRPISDIPASEQREWSRNHIQQQSSSCWSRATRSQHTHWHIQRLRESPNIPLPRYRAQASLLTSPTLLVSTRNKTHCTCLLHRSPRNGGRCLGSLKTTRRTRLGTRLTCCRLLHCHCSIQLLIFLRYSSASRDGRRLCGVCRVHG